MNKAAMDLLCKSALPEEHRHFESENIVMYAGRFTDETLR